MPLAFTVPGEPRGKGRPRATIRRSKSGTAHAGTYTDAKTRAYEAKVTAAAVKAMAGATPYVGPLAVRIRVRIAIPKSFSKAKRGRILLGVEHYAGAFDLDNVAKAILDGLNKVCFGDDKQIDELFVVRQPSERGGVDIKITHIEGSMA